MITQAESGLTVDEYNALLAAEESPLWQVIAHRYNLNMIKQDVSALSPVESANSDFDAVYLSNKNWIAWLSRNQVRWISPTGVAVPVTTSITAGTAGRPSLYYNGTALSIYQISGTNLIKNDLTFSGTTVTVGATSTTSFGLGANESVTLIAAVNTTRIHFVVYNSVTRNSNLRVMNSGTPVASDIWYQYPIQSFDAALDAQGGDVLAVATQTPGTTSVKTEGTAIKRYIEYAGGIIVFRYYAGMWSNHREVDIIDRLNDNRIRRSVRIHNFNNELYITAFTQSGDELFPYSSYKLYTSKNWRHWSLGVVIPMNDVLANKGLRLVLAGNFVYAFDYGNCFRDHATYQIGVSSPEVQVDLTPYISEYSFNHQKSAQVSITIESPDGYWENHPIVNRDNVIMLKHYAGFRTDTYLDGVMIEIATTEVDSINQNRADQDDVISLTARDKLAWLMDKNSAEDAEYWESQLVGAEQFTDDSGTPYGGLRHSAIQTGSWQTKNNALELANKNKEGIIFNTFSPYVWNGTFKTKFNLAQNSNNELAGLTYRGIDKDNTWIAVYSQAVDKIVVYLRQGGVSTQKAIGATLSWATIGTTRHMRIEFYYATLKIQTSSDGLTWSNYLTYVMDGQALPGVTAPMLLDVGYVGHIAKGYHPETTWTTPTFTMPSFEFQAPNLDFKYSAPMIIPTAPAEEEELFSPEQASYIYQLLSVLRAMIIGASGPFEIQYDFGTGYNIFSPSERYTGNTWVPSGVGANYRTLDGTPSGMYTTTGTNVDFTVTKNFAQPTLIKQVIILANVTPSSTFYTAGFTSDNGSNSAIPFSPANMSVGDGLYPYRSWSVNSGAGKIMNYVTIQMNASNGGNYANNKGLLWVYLLGDGPNPEEG